jgi:hypothetical protein
MSRSTLDHTGGRGGMSVFVDQDEGAGDAIGAILVEGQRRCGGEADSGNIVSDEAAGGRTGEGRAKRCPDR